MWLFLHKHTRAHAELRADPAERDTSSYSASPGAGTTHNASRRVPLIEAASEQQGHLLD